MVKYIKANDNSNYKYYALISPKEWNSVRKEKINKEKKVGFGNKNYQQYKDKLGKFKHLDHNDETRRNSYKKRHSGIINSKYNKPAYLVKYSPGYFSWNLLW